MKSRKGLDIARSQQSGDSDTGYGGGFGQRRQRIRGDCQRRTVDRPKLLAMIDPLRDGDMVVVWKLDRLSRSPKDMLPIMERIKIAGSGFRSLTEAINTTTAAGRMVMQMVGSFAEFARAMVRERTRAGRAQARPERMIGGRRRKLTEQQRRAIPEAVVSGRKSGADMARLYDASEPSASRIVAVRR